MTRDQGAEERTCTNLKGPPLWEGPNQMSRFPLLKHTESVNSCLKMTLLNNILNPVWISLQLENVYILHPSAHRSIY